jgi:hypothetical protein
MISNGQARRIAAEWQAPGCPTSTLQHVGVIEDGLIEELLDNVQHADADAERELTALIAWAEVHGPGRVAEWGAWDDTPAH